MLLSNPDGVVQEKPSSRNGKLELRVVRRCHPMQYIGRKPPYSCSRLVVIPNITPVYVYGYELFVLLRSLLNSSPPDS
jgi:hypothetical protein